MNTFFNRQPYFFLLVLATVAFPFAQTTPDQFLISSGWRSIHAEYSPLNNPAFLTKDNFAHFRVVYGLLQDKSFIRELGFTLPVGLRHSLGITGLLLNEPAYSDTGFLLDSLGRRITIKRNLFPGTWAFNPWKHLGVGINLNLAYRSIAEQTPHWGFGADVGITYDLPLPKVAGEHCAGIAVQNIITPRFDKVPSPQNLLFSLYSNYLGRRFSSSFDFSLDNFAGIHTSAAPESWAWELSSKLSILPHPRIRLSAIGNFSQESPPRWGIAGEFEFTNPAFEQDVVFSYQYSGAGDGKSSNHSFYGRAELGESRLTADVLFKKGLALYAAKKYWDAFFTFGMIIAEYDDYDKSDWVEFYLASCQERLSMFKTARDNYKDIKHIYLDSPVSALAGLRELVIEYRLGNDEAADNLYYHLDSSGTADSIRFCARYEKAQALIQRQKYEQAATLLEAIPDWHPAYLFAQHSLASINFTLENYTVAKNNLMQCATFNAQTPVETEMVNRSKVKLGYLYYEKSDQFDSALVKGIVILRDVAPESFYYNDALLGQGWIALKAQKWKDAIGVAAQLADFSEQPALAAEGYLIKGYAYLMMNDFSHAVSDLQQAEKLAQKAGLPDTVSHKARKHFYDSLLIQIDSIGVKAGDLAVSEHRNRQAQKIAALTIKEEPMEKGIQEFVHFTDENKRISVWNRRLPQLKEDIQYVLATALRYQTKATGSAPSEKEKRIDSQIEKLKEKVKDLETQKK